MSTGLATEHEAAWFKAVRNAMLQLFSEIDPLEAAEYWAGTAEGFQNMPPWGKRKWLAWAEQRAAAGDERFQTLFARLTVMRLQG